MMAARVALLCRNTCQTAVATLDYFHAKGCPIDVVVIETAERTKYSQNELQAAKNYREFLRVRPSARRRSMLRTVWDSLPDAPRAALRRNAHWLPVLRRGSVAWHARRAGAAVYRVERHSSAVTCAVFEKHGIDYALLASSAWLLKEPLLSMPRTRIINLHIALLPQHRGLDCLPWSVLDGDDTGLTAHFVDAGIDTGPTLFFRPVRPERTDDLHDLDLRIFSVKPDMFYEVVQGLQAGTIVPSAQPPGAGRHHTPMTLQQLLLANEMVRQQAATID